MPDSSIPPIGLGTWQNSDPEECAESVRVALELGYRHVDTAEAYRNEEAVGAGLGRSNVDRSDVFVATKVWSKDLDPEDVHRAARGSLQRLGVQHVDLLYVHWPTRAYEAKGTLGAFAELREEGIVRAVGISNFTPELVEEAVAACPAPIAAHQVEMHPLLPQTELRALAREHDHAIVAYSPLARQRVLEVPEVVEVANRRDATPAQVSLAWIMAKGAVPIPKATSRGHIEENLGALDLELTDEDVALLDGIDQRLRVVDPRWAPWR